MGKYPSYCCQKCGENVGYLGKIIEFIYYKIFRLKMFKHKCETWPVIIKGQYDCETTISKQNYYLKKHSFIENPKVRI